MLGHKQSYPYVTWLYDTFMTVVSSLPIRRIAPSCQNVAWRSKPFRFSRNPSECDTIWRKLLLFATDHCMLQTSNSNVLACTRIGPNNPSILWVLGFSKIWILSFTPWKPPEIQTTSPVAAARGETTLACDVATPKVGRVFLRSWFVKLPQIPASPSWRPQLASSC